MVLAGLRRAQGNMVAGQGGCGGTDNDQDTQQQSFVVAQRGHYLGHAAFQGPESNHAGGDLFLHHGVGGPLLTADLLGSFQ